MSGGFAGNSRYLKAGYSVAMSLQLTYSAGIHMRLHGDTTIFPDLLCVLSSPV